MADWWTEYEGKFPGAGVFFPESDWLPLNSINGHKLMTYRFHIEHPRALIFSFHGMYSESNESAHVAKKFFEAGYTVLAFDQEGHGQSRGTKGKIKNLKNYLQDSIKFIRKAKKRYPPVPVIVFGLSMGGTICTMLALSVPELLNGMILLAPGLGVAPDFEPFLRKLVKCLNICCGCLKLKEFDGSLSNRNPHYIRYFKENPYNYSGRMDVNTAYSMLSGLENLQTICTEVNIPLLVIQGTADKVVDAEMIKAFVKDCKSPDKHILLYEGMYHDVYHEPEIEEITEKMLEWVDLHLDL